MKLYFSNFSPPARAVNLVIKYLQLSNVELVETNVLSKKYVTPQFVKVNPQHTVPTLVDGDTVIGDSHAIAGYLVDKYGKSDKLYPKDPEKRCIVDQRLHFDSGILFPKLYDILFPLLYREKLYIPSLQREHVRRIYWILENFLLKNSYLAANHLTIADLSCIPSITTIDYVLPVDKLLFPRLKKYLDKCARRIPCYEEANQLGLDLLGQRVYESVIRSKQKFSFRVAVNPRIRIRQWPKISDKGSSRPENI